MSAGNHILVTGGTGFVGAHLLFHLTSAGSRVRALKRHESSTQTAQKIFGFYQPFSSSLWDMIEWVDGDLLDIASLEEAMAGIRQVYHAAAVVSFQGNNRSFIQRVNQIGTANLVNVALEKKVDKLLFVSSIGTLGRAHQSEPVTEETHWNNKKTSVYSKSKYEAEREVWRGMAEGLNAVIINPSIIIGPGNWSHGSPQLFQTMYNGLKFYTSGSNGFVGVNDVVHLMILLMNGPFAGERYIVSSENVPYRELFRWMADALHVQRPSYHAGKMLSGISWRLLAIKGWLTGKKSSITKETAQTANQKYRYSNAKVCEATGFVFTPVKTCVEETAEIFLKDIR